METDLFADEEPSVDDTIFQDLRFVGGSWFIGASSRCRWRGTPFSEMVSAMPLGVNMDKTWGVLGFFPVGYDSARCGAGRVWLGACAWKGWL